MGRGQLRVCFLFFSIVGMPFLEGCDPLFTAGPGEGGPGVNPVLPVQILPEEGTEAKILWSLNCSTFANEVCFWPTDSLHLNEQKFSYGKNSVTGELSLHTKFSGVTGAYKNYVFGEKFISPVASTVDNLLESKFDKFVSSESSDTRFSLHRNLKSKQALGP